MKLKKKEDQSVDTSFLLRMGNKIPMQGVTETKFRSIDLYLQILLPLNSLKNGYQSPSSEYPRYNSQNT